MFNKIPNILYDIDLKNRPVLVKNIFRHAHTIDSYRNNSNFYFYHTIKSTETIEDLAEFYYDNARLSWVILLYNEIQIFTLNCLKMIIPFLVIFRVNIFRQV